MRRILPFACALLAASCFVSIGDVDDESGGASGGKSGSGGSGGSSALGGSGGSGGASAGSGGASGDDGATGLGGADPNGGSGGVAGSGGGSGGSGGGAEGGSGAPGTLVFSDDFSAGLANWAAQGDGSWSANTGAALQATTTATTAVLYAKTVDVKAVRFVAKGQLVTAQGTDSAYELLAGGTFGANSSYHHCNWEPVARRMLVKTFDGSSVTTIEDKIVAAPPSYDPKATVTMELVINGSVISCKVHEVPGAEMTATLTVPLAGGGVAFKTWKASASFDDVQVFAL